MAAVPHLVILGLGFSGRAIAKLAAAQGAAITGTTRSEAKQQALVAQGFNVVRFDGERADDELIAALQSASHVVSSISPIIEASGDVALKAVKPYFGTSLQWLGYLSTIGVYGDQDGGWVDEATPPAPTSPRTRRRVEAETAWIEAGEELGIPMAVFRLSGIYGPGRSPLEKIKAGTSRRIVKPGQVFNRIHADDIAATVMAAAATNVGGVFNVTDDEPAPPQEVIAFGAELLGVTPPPEIPFDEADLSPMARSFYSDNKRVRNHKMKSLLGRELTYFNYRVGLRSLIK